LRDPAVSVEDSKAIAAHSPADDPSGKKWTSRNSFGSGPYTLSAWNTGTSLVLKANPNYWGSKPFFSTVTLQVVPSPEDRVLLLKNGSIDIADDLSLDFINQLKGSSGITVVTATSLLQYFFGLLQNKAPFNSA